MLLYADSIRSSNARKIVVCNKLDLVTSRDEVRQWTINEIGYSPIFTSCTDGSGIVNLENGIKQEITYLLDNQMTDSTEDGIAITRERHRIHVHQCIEHLNNFISMNLPMDAAAEEIRYKLSRY